MSVIAGVFSRGSNGEHTKARLLGMLATMQSRFSDGHASLTIDPVSMGLGWLNTLDERIGGPFSLSDNSLSIVGDIRLDNRDVLIPILGDLPMEITDSELIMRAYQKWGEGVPIHLEGDFAFALWDAEKQLMFCARDRFGIRPFYFNLTDRQFAFASDISALVEMPNVRIDVDEGSIADFLVGLPGEVDQTAFRQIRRLPPGYFMKVTHNAVQSDGYWAMHPVQSIGDSDALPEAFAELFARSVKNRMRGTEKLGVMLSGGLDSSSIACVARDLRSEQRPGAINTYSLIFDQDSGADESHLIHSVINTGGLEANFQGPRMPEPFGDYENVIHEQSELFLAPGLSNIRAIYAQANGDGKRVLLDGHGGDEVVSHGFGRLGELAKQGRWMKLWVEVFGASKALNIHPIALYLRLMANRHSRAAHIPNVFGRLSQFMVPYRLKAKFKKDRTAWRHLVNESLVHRSDLVTRYAKARGSRAKDASEQFEHLHNITNPLIPHAFEVLGRAASANCIEPRYPFWDKELVTFCLGLPASRKLNNGWTRLILRQAMEGILPTEVQWRRDKSNFTSSMATSILSSNQNLMRSVMGDEVDRIAPYVNVDFLRKAFTRLSQQGDQANLDDIQHVWRSVWLSLWLKQMEREISV